MSIEYCSGLAYGWVIPRDMVDVWKHGWLIDEDLLIDLNPICCDENYMLVVKRKSISDIGVYTFDNEFFSLSLKVYREDKWLYEKIFAKDFPQLEMTEPQFFLFTKVN